MLVLNKLVTTHFLNEVRGETDSRVGLEGHGMLELGPQRPGIGKAMHSSVSGIPSALGEVKFFSF